MASIRNDLTLQAGAAAVWDAVRDFGALAQRLVPGFVTDCRLDGDARVVTFANGLVARELLVDCDDRTRRLAYAIVGGRAQHYNASVEVIEVDARCCRVLWIIDLLPHELAGPIGAMAAEGAAAMKRHFAKA
ncbi:MAG TPA: SRPBCC family protein [Burkholderiaceae bacterium]|nr:SRPBCC family protein [Burkholderiaceae bacterium]